MTNATGTQGYCVKCKEKRTMANTREETMSSGRRILKGSCPVCGTTVTRILGKT